jgi:hypothetical protein
MGDTMPGNVVIPRHSPAKLIGTPLLIGRILKMAEKKTVIDSLIELFNRPKPNTIKYAGQEITIYTRSLNDAERLEYFKIIGDNKNPEQNKVGMKYIYSKVLLNEDGTPAFTEEDFGKLNSLNIEGQGELIDLVLKSAFAIKLSDEERKNLQGSHS